MDHYLQQNFEINNLKVGYFTNSGVLQIGVGAGSNKRVSPVAGYTTVGEYLVPLSAAPLLLSPPVPLIAPVRKK